jgi:prenyltransferase beta subunit
MNKKIIEEFQEWIKQNLNDPLAKTLLENSNLTKTQFETFLIDIFSKHYHSVFSKSEIKAALRLKGKVSRGAFNRTKAQAIKNIIKAIYTILLLGYTGIFDSSKLDPFIELSQKLDGYIKNIKKEGNYEKYSWIAKILEEELKEALNFNNKKRKK